MKTDIRCVLNPERDFLLRHIRSDKTIVGADNVYLIDEDGNRYLDFLAQYGAVPFGHTPAPLWEAIAGFKNMPSMVQPLYTPASKALAKRLLALASRDLEHVVF